MHGGRILVLLLLVLTTFTSFAQKKSKTQLQKEKQQQLEKINQVEKVLTETSTLKKNSLGELNAVNAKVSEQEKLIGSIAGEVAFLDQDIEENNNIILALEEDLVKIKEEYKAMLFAAQKAGNNTTRLTFLFSAATFDQMVMRLQYMEQYSQARRNQADQIKKVQAELSGQVQQIETIRNEKASLLAEEVREKESLTELKKKQSQLIKSLEREERKLRRDLDESKKAIAKLDKLIDDIIKAELASNVKSRSAESVALSSSFEENRAKFPWPVNTGFISMKFGRQNHPVLKGIVIQNNGINIQTRENEKVKSVFSGEVRAVAFIQAMGSTVIIKHGDYLTVYAGLKDVFVRMGQKVTTNQEIGNVYANPDGVTELKFQIFRNTTALNPEEWLGIL